MGKKTATVKPVTDNGDAPAKPAAARATAPKKAAAPKVAAAKKAASQTAISPDDIALRAYFIAEKRQAQGLPGDAHQDWLEAERQLLAEAKKKSAKKAAPKKPAVA